MDLNYLIKNELLKRHTKSYELAEKCGYTKQNLSLKLTKNDMRVSDLEKIANALDCDLSISFIPKDNVNQ